MAFSTCTKPDTTRPLRWTCSSACCRWKSGSQEPLIRCSRRIPQNGDRLRKTQEEINTILPDKAEYVVNTSEYVDMQSAPVRPAEPSKEPGDRSEQAQAADGRRAAGTIPVEDGAEDNAG